MCGKHCIRVTSAENQKHMLTTSESEALSRLEDRPARIVRDLDEIAHASPAKAVLYGSLSWLLSAQGS